MTPKEKLIQWVKDTAQRNYENGGHVIIETYTDEDIEQMIDDGITFKEFFRMLNTWTKDTPLLETQRGKSEGTR